MSKYRFIHTPADSHRPMVSYSGDTKSGTTRGQTLTVQVSYPPALYPNQELGAFLTERTPIGIHHCQPGARHGAHAHPTWEQAFYIMSGKVEFTVGDEKAVVGPGSSVFVPPGVMHDFANAGEEELVMAVMSSMLEDTEG